MSHRCSAISCRAPCGADLQRLVLAFASFCTLLYLIMMVELLTFGSCARHIVCRPGIPAVSRRTLLLAMCTVSVQSSVAMSCLSGKRPKALYCPTRCPAPHTERVCCCMPGCTAYVQFSVAMSCTSWKYSMPFLLRIPLPRSIF